MIFVEWSGLAGLVLAGKIFSKNLGTGWLLSWGLVVSWVGLYKSVDFGWFLWGWGGYNKHIFFLLSGAENKKYEGLPPLLFYAL